MSRRARRYQECLRRIDRLERELFPEWFADELVNPWASPDSFDFSPGAVWLVNDHHAIQFLREAA